MNNELEFVHTVENELKYPISTIVEFYIKALTTPYQGYNSVTGTMFNRMPILNDILNIVKVSSRLYRSVMKNIDNRQIRYISKQVTINGSPIVFVRYLYVGDCVETDISYNTNLFYHGIKYVINITCLNPNTELDYSWFKYLDNIKSICHAVKSECFNISDSDTNYHQNYIFDNMYLVIYFRILMFLNVTITSKMQDMLKKENPQWDKIRSYCTECTLSGLLDECGLLYLFELTDEQDINND